MEKAALKALPEEEQKQKVRWVYDIYSGGVTIDGADVMDAIRALNLNPTLALLSSLGATDKRGEVTMTFEDFWKVYIGVRDDTDEGSYMDFVECLKIYDVGENGLMKVVDLTQNLLHLGEPLTADELDKVFKDCMLEEEDEDGWIPYLPFLCRLCEKPVPKGMKPV